MNNFKKYCELKFPQNWKIEDSGNNSFHFRDNQINRGLGFNVVVQEELNKYEVSINFENFAKDLSNHAEKIISCIPNSLSKLFESCPNLTTIVHKHYIETNLNPESIIFENWDLNIIYKKVDEFNDADKFSDILISSILFLFPYELEGEEEGAAKSEILTKYERSHLNRSLCLAYHGYNCKACNINLKEQYGDIARNFIHVHHLCPISESGKVIPNPITDFVPLCPNCHSIAHLRTPPLTIEEIQNMINKNGNTNIK